MPRSFPRIRPYRRSYTPGTFPESKFRALNGAVTTIRYGNRRTDSTLDADFQNVKDRLAAEVLALYEDMTRDGDWLVFTGDDVLSGLYSDLPTWVGEKVSGLRWRFAEPPSVESVQPGLSSVSCRFVAELDGVI